MGEFYNQLAGGLRRMDHEQTNRCQVRTAAMLAELREHGRLTVPLDSRGHATSFVTWPGTANEYVACNETLCPAELDKALAFGERWLSLCQA